MICIPTVDWIEKNDKKTKFDDFQIEGDQKVIKQLKERLRDFNIHGDSDNLITLKIREKVEETEEEYKITIMEKLVKIESPTVGGLSHGLSTLKLMMHSDENFLVHGTIIEAPKFKSRGVFLDVSRGKMPSMDYLKDLISFLSDLKYNVLQLYSEDKLSVISDPSVGSVTGTYSEDNIKELDEWCKTHFIELQPCIQTYSHLHGILTLPEYEHLSENENLFSMAAGNEEVYKFFDRKFAEVLPWYSSKTLNVNMDEAYDLGTGYTKVAVDKYGKGQVYLDHIKRIYDIAKKHGAKKIIIWGDIALKYKELLNMLPEDIIVADWNYNPIKEFKSLETLSNSKVEFWAGGGVGTWNSLFPRIYNSYINLRYYSTESYKKGATGFLVTDWGDYGHAQSLGLSLYGYMIGAQQSYKPMLTPIDDLENNIFPLIFKDKLVEEAFRHLMDSNLAENLKTDFKTMSIYYMFDDMFDGLSMNGSELYPKLTDKTFETLYDTGSKAYTKLNEVMSKKNYGYNFLNQTWNNLFGEVFLEELRLSARTTQYTGKKGKLSLKIKDSFRTGEITPKEILTYIVEIKELYSEFILIRREFEDVWSKRAYRNSIETNLLIFDKAGVQLGEAVTWLSAQYRNLKNNEEIDREMKTYTAGKNYTILWTADYKHMWERAYPWQ